MATTYDLVQVTYSGTLWGNAYTDTWYSKADSVLYSYTSHTSWGWDTGKRVTSPNGQTTGHILVRNSSSATSLAPKSYRELIGNGMREADSYGYTDLSGGISLVQNGGVDYTQKLVLSNGSLTGVRYSRTCSFYNGVAQGSNQITITAPATWLSDYAFVGFSDDGGGTVLGQKVKFDYAASDQTAVAAYSPKFTISFDSNGGSGSMSDQSCVKDTSQTIDANAFTREGYSFDGWMLAPSSESTIDDEASVDSVYSGASASPGDTITLYAKWTKQKYTVTFDANGGNGGWSQQMEYGATITAPTVTREGHSFAGWLPSVVASTVPIGGATYTAQWTVNQYTATFDANGGNGGTSKTQNYGTALAAPTVSREGYAFSSWSPSVPSTMPASNNTYTAQWTPNTYTVTLNRDPVSSGTGSVTATYGVAMPTITPPGRTGYAFGGYYAGTKGIGTKYYNANGTSAHVWDKANNTTTLYAKWTANTYVVTFDANGGSFPAGTPTTLTVEYDAKYNKNGNFPVPTRAGYTLLNWKTSGNVVVSQNDTVTITAPMTLYANWSANKTYLSYNLNEGGYGTYHPASANFGTAVQISAPSRDHYVFKGWLVTGDVDQSVAKYGTTSSPSAQLKSGMTIGNGSASIWVKDLSKADGKAVSLTAQWERISYTITANMASMRWDVKIEGVSGLSGSELSGLPVDLPALASGGAAYSKSFTAYAGGKYRITATMKHVSMVFNLWYVPTAFGGKALTRQAGNVANPVVFTAEYTFGNSESASQTWGMSSYQVSVATGDNPLSESPLYPTVSFASGEAGNTNVKVVAAETTKSMFESWEYDTTAVTPVSVSGKTIVVPVAANVALTANYERRPQAVSAQIDARTASVMNGISGVALSATVTQSGTAVAEVGYGLSATWTFTATGIPTDSGGNPLYEFAGWYRTSSPASSTEEAEYLDTSVTIDNITAPVTLYARMRARVKFIADVNGEGVAGGIAANGGEMFVALPAEQFYPIGTNISISAVPMNEDSHFNGWFTDGMSHADGTRIAGLAANAGYTIGESASLIAYFTATSAIFYVALYQRNAATRSYNDFADLYGTLALATSEGEVEKFNSWSDYKAASGHTPPYQAKGVYYQVIGIRRVDATLTQTASQTTGAKRIVRGTPAYGAVANEVEIADRMPFSAVIDADCSFVVDFGDVSHRNLVADVVSVAGQQVGGIARTQDAEGIVGRTDVSETGRYEIGMKAVAVATPDNGYKFDGWFSSSAGTGTALSTNVKYEFTMPSGETDYRIYAKFSLGSFALYKWEGSERRKQLSWKSKVYELSKPANLTSVRVDATTLNSDQPAYPLARFRYESFSSPDAQAAASGTVDFAAGNMRIQNQTMRRLPMRRPERYFQVEVENAAEVDGIIIGTSGEGLAT